VHFLPSVLYYKPLQSSKECFPHCETSLEQSRRVKNMLNSSSQTFAAENLLNILIVSNKFLIMIYLNCNITQRYLNLIFSLCVSTLLLGQNLSDFITQLFFIWQNFIEALKFIIYLLVDFISCIFNQSSFLKI
jgi:hypothetical protein